MRMALADYLVYFRKPGDNPEPTLGVIERAVKLWSAPGDLIFSPFAGIGSEGYVSLKLDRHFVGIELKESYFREACRHLREAEAAAKAGDLFGGGRLVAKGVAR